MTDSKDSVKMILPSNDCKLRMCTWPDDEEVYNMAPLTDEQKREVERMFQSIVTTEAIGEK